MELKVENDLRRHLYDINAFTLGLWLSMHDTVASWIKNSIIDRTHCKGEWRYQVHIAQKQWPKIMTILLSIDNYIATISLNASSRPKLSFEGYVTFAALQPNNFAIYLLQIDRKITQFHVFFYF